MGASKCVKRFRGGLLFKAHRLLYHSTLGLRVIKKKKKKYAGLGFNGPPSSELGTNKPVKARFWPWLSGKSLENRRAGWLNGLGGVPREQKMLKGHLPRVIYHQVY